MQDPTQIRTYQGSCHCGAVRFEVTTALEPAIRCNCSICRRKGAVMKRVDPENFRLLAGEDSLCEYRFNTGAATHYFCRTCGIYPFHHPRTAPDLYVVNLGCLDGVDPLALEVGLNDGAAYTTVES